MSLWQEKLVVLLERNFRCTWVWICTQRGEIGYMLGADMYPKTRKRGTRWLGCVPKNGILGTHNVQPIRLTVFIVSYYQAVKKFVNPKLGH